MTSCTCAPASAGITVGELRRQLADLNDTTWQVSESLRDDEPVPIHATGGIPQEISLSDGEAAPDLDFSTLCQGQAQSGNAFIRTRIQEIRPMDAWPVAGAGWLPIRARSVDWRNRWNTPWLTTIQNQGPCLNCWAFAVAALVETMVRIEHCVWSKRSEGDVRDGFGASINLRQRDMVPLCDHGAGITDALDWAVAAGVADPGCYAWTTADVPHRPTPDREGRTTRLHPYTRLTTVETQKIWIDLVGPITGSFEVHADFMTAGAHVYRKSPNAPWVGNHDVLIVGYDDDAGCWLVKNSWGAGWGDRGFGRIAYGECRIDEFTKFGLRSTSPDPWTKRRLHNGCLLESGAGVSHKNFEVLRPGPPRVRHLSRASGEGGNFAWSESAVLAKEGDVGAGAGCIGLPALTATTYHRNLECVYREASGRLRHWWFDQDRRQWHDGGQFGPRDVAGFPAFIQSNYGAPGNFEVVVRTADGRLNAWWRGGGPSWRWHDSGRFASGVKASGPSLVQVNRGRQGDFHLVCVLDSGQMQHWRRDNDRGAVWAPLKSFGGEVGETPVCMIEAQFGARNELAVGNFELCVAVGGQIQHWWHDNTELSLLFGDGGPWRRAATFGRDIRHVWGLLQGSFGFNLELIAERLDGTLQHFWRNQDGWHEGDVVDA